MLAVTVALAGVAAAGGCCLAPSRWRARALAIVMAVACLPFLPDVARIAAALALIVSAMGLAPGLRRLPAADRAADLHRAVGGVLMAGMLLAGGHAVRSPSVEHAHGASLSPHLLFAVASAVYLGWTIVKLGQSSHRVAGAVAGRIELGAMGAMFALLLIAMPWT